MIVTVSACCERLSRACPPARRRASVHPAPAAQTPAPRPGFSQPSFAVPGAVLGVSLGSAPEPGTWLTVAYCIVDNFSGNVDGEAAENFFHAQAVDGISAGSRASGR